MGLTWKYIKRVVKNIKNESFKEFILNYDLDPYLVKFQELGEALPDKNIMIIRNENASHGFFAEYRMTLNYLAYADRYHFIPYVFYSKNYCYAEKEKVNGTDNPFEYYFEQPNSLKYEEAFSGKNVIFSRSAHSDMVEILNRRCFSYEISDAYIEYMAMIVAKYMKYNASTKEYLDAEVKKIFGNGKVLGVHYRGTDFRNNYNNHPICIEIENEIEKVKELIDGKDYDRIFLATDEEEALMKFVKVFGDKVLYYKDVYRGNEKTSVAFSENQRKNHHYHLGLEVLRDMYTLAKCDGLIAGMSQVSNIARINKKAMGKEYEYLNIINQGINSNNKNFQGERK